MEAVGDMHRQVRQTDDTCRRAVMDSWVRCPGGRDDVLGFVSRAAFPGFGDGDADEGGIGEEVKQGLAQDIVHEVGVPVCRISTSEPLATQCR